MQEHVKSMEEEKDAIQASIRDSQSLSIFQLTSKLEKLQDEVAKTQVYHSYPDIVTVQEYRLPYVRGRCLSSVEPKKLLLNRFKI